MRCSREFLRLEVSAYYCKVRTVCHLMRRAVFCSSHQTKTVLATQSALTPGFDVICCFLTGFTGKWVRRFVAVAGPEGEGLCHPEQVSKYCYVLELAMSKDATHDSFW